MHSDQTPVLAPQVRNEAVWALTYFAMYLTYLFFSLEGEVLHWLSLVALPFGLVYLYQAKRSESRGMKAILGSFGLEKGNLGQGLWWAILVGLVLSALQLLLSRNSGQILAILTSGKFVYLFPISLVLMLLTAGFTEEFFFRGFLQTRLQRLFSSKVAAILIVSVLFGIYHLPYAYLNTRWPSHGNLSEAFSLALGQGVPMGLILGTFYLRTRNNLLACIVVHSLLNSLPAMLIIRF